MTAALAAQARIPRNRLFTERYRQLFRGVFIPEDEPLSLSTWVSAARLVLPADAAVTGLTALQLRGLDLGQLLPLQFAISRDVRSRRNGICLVRRAGLPQAGGTVPMLVAIDEVCATSDLLDAVTIIDRCLHLELISPDDLLLLAAGPDATRRPALLARPGAESVRETRLRLCLIEAGLPEPRLQVNVEDEHGWVGRFDLGFEQHRLLVEYDGDQHRTDKRQWSRDIMRVERAQKVGLGVVRVTGELFSDPWSQVRRVHAELVERGYRGPAPRPSTCWQELFGSPQRRSGR